MQPFKAIVFDIDDTLFDRQAAQRKIVQGLIKKYPNLFSQMDPQPILDAFLAADQAAHKELTAERRTGANRVRRSQIFLQMLGLNDAFAEEIAAAYLHLYGTVEAPIKDAKEVVQRLAGQYRLGVVSNGFLDMQYRKLDSLGIRCLFDDILLSEAYGVRKPDPRIFAKSVATLAAEPQQTLFIGDSFQDDMVGAKQAGLRTCWFNPLRSPIPLTQPSPDFEIEALHQLLRIVTIR